MAPRVSFTTRDVQEKLQQVTVRLRHHAAEIPRKIRVDVSKVPDWQRRATRLSLAMVFFGVLGHCVTFPPEHHNMASNFRQSCNWAAITCIVVTAPLIGKVAQVAFDRLLGTAAGGIFGCICFTVGFHLFGVVGGGIFISLMSALTIWTTTFLAFRHGLDQLARFVQLTYVIVAFGAKPDKGAVLLALLRVGGIFAGGLFSVLLAVMVLPRSASVESLREMKKALKALHDLNQEVWALSGVTGTGLPSSTRRHNRKQHRHGYSALQLRLESATGSFGGSAPASATTGGGSGQPGRSVGLHPVPSDSELPSALTRGRVSPFDLSSDHLNLLVQHDEERDSNEARVEKLFTGVYTALGRVEENLAACKGEIYVHHFWGHYFFLPGVHWFPVRGRWRVPAKDLQDMATCLRRVARMLWTLLLDFEEGFGDEMEAVLQLYYPKQLLSELANYQSRAIVDLLRAFPNDTTIEVDNLLTLGQVTDCLLQISDARARETFFSVKRKRAPRRSQAGAGGAGSTPAPAGTGADGLREQTPEAPMNGRAQGTAPAAEAEMAKLDKSWRGGSQADIVTGAGVQPTDSFLLEKVPLLSSQPQRPPLPPPPPSPPAAPQSRPLASRTTAPAASRDPSAHAVTPVKAPSAASGASAAARQHSGTNGAMPAWAGSSARLQPSTSGSALTPSGGSTFSAPGGAGFRSPSSGSGSPGGVFISRLLSGQPGGQVALHLPPRRFLMEQTQQLKQLQQLQQQQQQQMQHVVVGSREGLQGRPVAAAPLTPIQAQLSGSQPAAEDGTQRLQNDAQGQGGAAAVAGRRSESFDIFDNVRFESLALPTEVSADTSPRISVEVPQVTGRQQQAQQQQRGEQQQQQQLLLQTAELRHQDQGLPSRRVLHEQTSMWRIGAAEQPEAAGAVAAAAAAAAAPAGRPPEAASPFSSVANLRNAEAAAGSLRSSLDTSICTGSKNTATIAAATEPEAAKGAAAAGAAGKAAAAQATAAVNGTALPATPGYATPKPNGALDSSNGAAGAGGAGEGSVGSEGGNSGFFAGGIVGASAMSSMLSALQVEPVTFPPTEEGYLSQVRWYSFQFVMDEMVEELEEAFHACSAVLRKLPYPIGGS